MHQTIEFIESERNDDDWLAKTKGDDQSISVPLEHCDAIGKVLIETYGYISRGRGDRDKIADYLACLAGAFNGEKEDAD